MERKFRYSLDNFRGLSIIFVMFSHLSSFEALGTVGDASYFLVGNATAWFVFISGYLFYYIESKNFQYADYLLKKLKFVIIPYLLLSIPAILAGMYFSRPKVLGLDNASYVIWSLIVGGSIVGPMWFIPMIAVFFLMSPLFHRLANHRAVYPMAALALVFSMFSARPLNGTNPLLSFLHFLGFYLMGLAFAKSATYTSELKTSTRRVLIVAGFTLFLWAALWYEGPYSDAPGFFVGLGTFNLLQFGKWALLIMLFFLFEQSFNRPNRMLGYFAKVSFGLFFIHGFHSVFFSKFKQYVPYWSTLQIFLGEVFFVAIAPVATVYVLKLLLGKKSRYVIGC